MSVWEGGPSTSLKDSIGCEAGKIRLKSVQYIMFCVQGVKLFSTSDLRTNFGLLENVRSVGGYGRNWSGIA